MREMKDSGIAWIGSIPNSWSILRHKNVMHKEKALCEHYSGEDIISLSMNGVIVRDLEAGGKMPASFDGYQYVEPGDLLQCLFDIDVTPRCVGLVKNHGLTSPAYSRFKLYRGYSAEYYNYLLRSLDDRKEFVHLSKNLRSSLTEDDFGCLPTIAPPYLEQQAIANYLDEKCSEIEKLINNIKLSISDYKKLKQSIIMESVTRGIRGERPMKDSGLELVGNIPLDWEVKKVKYWVESFSKGNGITKDEVFADGDIPCVRYGEIYSKYGNSFSNCVSATKLEEQVSPQYFSKGDILCAATGELVEEIGKGIAYIGDNPCLAGGDIIIIRHKQNPIFINYVLNSSYAQAQKSCQKTKLKVVHISASDIGDVLIALPTIDEQNQIASHLDQKCSEIDSLIESKEIFIKELESYRKNLVYEYVTGKKEVNV